MIKVAVIYQDKQIKSLSISGHANYAEYGKDLVCAGVSAIVVGLCNGLDQKADIQIKDNHYVITNINFKDEVNHYLDLALIQLETIAHSYKENIKIERKQA